MSRIIASAAIRGAHKIVGQAEEKWQQAMDKWGANEPVGFPNTAYYLPVIYGILGEKVEKLRNNETVCIFCGACEKVCPVDAIKVSRRRVNFRETARSWSRTWKELFRGFIIKEEPQAEETS